MSCVTAAVVSGRRYRPAHDADVLTLSAGRDPMPLGRDRRLFLWVAHYYLVVAGERRRDPVLLQTVGYTYQVLDRREQEIFSYQWHPTGRSPVTVPHLHLHVPTAPIDIHKAHFPTGFVTLASVLRVLITDLGVEPLRAD